MAKRRANGEGNLRKRKDGRWEGRYPGHLRPCDHGLPAPGGQNDGQYPLRQSPALNAPRSRMGHGLGQIKTAKIIIQKK